MLFPVHSMKPLSSVETTIQVQKHLYSRYTCGDSKFWNVKNGMFTRMNAFARNFRSQFLLSKSFNARHHSQEIFKSWSRQFEFVIADRFRRGFKLVVLYNKWWENSLPNLVFQRLTSELLKHRKFCFTACLAPLFEWDKERIHDEELLKSHIEIDYAKKLYFQGGKEENHAFPELPSPKSDCDCNRCKHLTYEGWSLIYTSNNMKIWRKEHLNHLGEGLYVYKVFGQFPDVTAEDFFRVQIDIDYRKKWDSNSVVLDIVESDTKSNSDILYWEFLFPKMFYNRDYVCNRRFTVDPDKKLFVIICESVDHPRCPDRPPIHRVKEYWSQTVIRSTADQSNEPGIEFTVTYFDNPEVNLPSYITLWYSVTGMPEYIIQQKKAALNLKDYKEKVEKESLPLPPEVRSKKDVQQTADKRVLFL